MTKALNTMYIKPNLICMSNNVVFLSDILIYWLNIVLKKETPENRIVIYLIDPQDLKTTK